MSGGYFDYLCFKIAETYEGCMEDPVLDAMLVDFVKVLHDLEWYKSCDIGPDDYHRTANWFKNKWIGRPAPILRDVVEQEMRNMRKRLLTAVAWTEGGATDGDGNK